MTEPIKNKVGRPKGSTSIWTPELKAQKKEEYLEHLSNGLTMTSFCKRPENPALSVLWGWMEDDKEFAESVAQARDKGHDVIADDCLAIADEEPPLDVNGRRDPAFVAWQKNRIWCRTQLLEKWNPKKYGNKIGLEHSGNVALDASIIAARKRANKEADE